MSEIFPKSVIMRDHATIQLFPWVYKWEFTRRHPYYLQQAFQWIPW